MKRLLLAFLLASGFWGFGVSTGCTPAVAPDGGVDGSLLSPSALYAELVRGGCLAADAPDAAGNGAAAIAEELLSDQVPSWLTCLVKGGTIVNCGVPCGAE